MAKRRINTPFIVISLLVLGVLLGGAYTLYKYRQKNPNRVIAIADDLYKQGKFLEASSHYAGAANLAKDASLFVKAGDIVYGLTYEDSQNLRRAEQNYASAIQTDPGCLPAYDKLIEMTRDQIALNSRPGANSQQRAAVQAGYDRLDDYAKAILRAKPEDLKAKRILVMNQLDRWMIGVELSPDAVKEAIDSFEALRAVNPKEVELIVTAARVKLFQASQLIARADKTEMRGLINEAFSILETAATADPENAELYYAQGVLALQAGRIDNGAAEVVKGYADRARAAFQAAYKVAKPTDTNYTDVVYWAAEVAKDGGDRKLAEQIYRDAVKIKPSELAFRTFLARVIGATPGRADEAIEVLKTAPAAEVTTLAGLKGALYKNTEAGAQLQLANLMVDKAAATQDPAQRDAVIKDALTIMDSITARYGESGTILRSRGKIELLKGDAASALGTLTKAWDKKDTQDAAGTMECLNLLARANLLTGQTSKAKEWLTMLLKAAPDYIEGRILLAQTLLRENNVTEAKAEIELLRKSPVADRPDIVELYMRTLDKQKDAAELQATFAKLPETNRQSLFAKVGVADAFGFEAEKLRLLELAVSKNPKDVDAWLLLSVYWEQTGKNKDKAVGAIAQALQASPEDARLNYRMKSLKGDKDKDDFVLSEIEKIPDTARRFEALFNYWTNQRDENKAVEALQNWEKASPDNLTVMEKLFTHYLGKGKIDQAQPYGDKLIAANADKAGGNLYRWNLAMAKGDLDKAQELASNLTRDHPEFAQSWLSLGQTLQAQGARLGETAEAKARYEAAIPKYNEALSRQGTNVQAYLGIIKCSEELRLDSDVRRYLEDAIAKTNNPVFADMLTNYEVNHGNPEKVIAKREEELKNDTENPRAYLALAEVYRATAGVRKDKGDEKGTVEYVGKAADVMAKAVEKFPDNLRFLMGYSELALIAGRGDDAEARWKTYVAGPGAKNPTETAVAMSGYYRRAGKIGDGEKVLRDALQAQGDKPEVMLQLALTMLLAQQNKYDEALKVLEANSDRPEIMRTRIDLLLRSDKRDEAATLIDQTLAKTQGPALDLHTMRGAILLAKGDDAGGMQEIEGVLKQDPDNLAALIQRGRRNATIGRTNDAIADLFRVREMLSDPQTATLEQAVQVRLLLADAYRLAGQQDRALAELESALDIDRTNKQLRLQLLSTYLNPTSPRFTDAERLTRDAHDIPVLANDPEILAAEAMMWSQRKDHQRARTLIVEALNRAPKNQALLATLFKIMLDGRQYQQLVQIIDQQPDDVKNAWWAQRDRAAAQFNVDKKNGEAAFNALLEKLVADKNYGAVGSVVDAAVAADSDNTDTGLKLLGDRIHRDPKLKLQAIQLNLNKNDFGTARTLVTELLAQGDQLAPDVKVPALQQAAVAWSSDPGRDDSKAQDAYLKLTELRPDDFVVWNNLASLESLPPEKALEYSQKARDLLAKANRIEPYVLDTYGTALLRLNRVDEAISVLSDAYNSLKFREVCLHLGEAYILKKEWDAAASRLEEAQNIYNRDVAEKRVSDGGAFQEKIAAAQRTISANK